MAKERLWGTCFLIAALCLISGCFGTGQVDISQPQCCLTQPAHTPAPTLTPTPIIATPPTPIPTPGYTPTLRPYLIDRSQEIWHASDASSYIIPNNEWVQYYAKNDLPVGIIYRTDESMYPSNPDKDVWQNADYTLYKMEGDCEDIAIADVSIDIALGKKAVVVGGYLTLDNGDRIKDFWEEVYSGGVKSIKAASMDMRSQRELRIEPLYMFNDEIQWQSYDENWYKI